MLQEDKLRETIKKIIIIKETALMQIVLSALEAFAVKHFERKTHTKYLETYGLLWGTLSIVEDNLFYTVFHITIDTSAKRTKSSVESNRDALTLKRDLITSFWPYYKFLGDFHTHPCKRRNNFDYKDVEKGRLFDFSEQDIRSIESDAEYWYRHNYRIGLVVTIIDMKKAIRKTEQVEDNLILFNLGNYRLWLKGYWTFYEDTDQGVRATVTEENVYLVCPHLTGIHEFCEFGRFRNGQHEEGEIGTIDGSAFYG